MKRYVFSFLLKMLSELASLMSIGSIIITLQGDPCQISSQTKGVNNRRFDCLSFEITSDGNIS